MKSSEEFDLPREPLIVLAGKGWVPIEDIVGIEPMTSGEFVRKLWDWIRSNELLKDRTELD